MFHCENCGAGTPDSHMVGCPLGNEEEPEFVLRQGQFLAKFPNGFEVSVITDGYGSEQGLFEALVRTPDGLPIHSADIIPGWDGEDVLGYLTPAKLGEVLHIVSNYRKVEVWALPNSIHTVQ